MEYLKFVEPAFKLLVLIAAVAWWFFHSRSRSKKLAKELELAISDIAFLLQVEQEYGIESKLHHGTSMKNLMRQRAKTMGYKWSGKFTRGSIISKANTNDEEPKNGVIEIIK